VVLGKTARQKQHNSTSSIHVLAMPIGGTSYNIPAALQVLAQTKYYDVPSEKFLQDLAQEVQ